MKKLVSFLLLAALACIGIFAAVPQVRAAESMELLYDDRKDLSALIGTAVTSVEISNQQVTSYQVGTQTADAAVLSYEASTGTLYAVGTGTATLTVNGTAYNVTVKPAKLTMFLITGHSVGWGEAGAAGQSVAVEPGQAYSSWFRTSLKSAEGGLGYGSAVRAGTGTGEYGIDAFAQGQSGTQGVGSGLAYAYNQLTGDKVWVINLAIPGSCINEWIPGQEGHHSNENYKYKYESVLEVFGNAQQIAKNEIAAGHYTLGEMSMLYFCGANFGNAGYSDWTFESLKSDYHTFWEGLKADLALDMDGDGQTETLESMGFVPFWSASSRTYSTDKAVAFYMAASADYPDVYMAHTRYRNWTVASGLSDFPAIDYTTQGTAVTVPSSVQHSDNGGSSVNSVFCQKDKTHPSQVTYNAIGLDMAKQINAWYTADTTVTAATLRSTAYEDLSQVTLNVGQTYTMVPDITPITGNGLTLELSSNLTPVFPLGFQATAEGTGTATVKNHLGTVLDTISVTVIDHGHCVCGGHAAGISGHTCTSQEWTAWNSTSSLPTASGYYYLSQDVTLTGVQTVPEGQDVKLCLNGHSVSGTARPYSVKGKLSVTDCGAKSSWGTMSSTVTTTYGGIFFVYDNAVLNLYGGNFDASAANIHMGGVAIVGNATAATLNVYGGNLIGGTLVKYGSNTSNTRGGALYVISKSIVNIYGGTITGGTAQEGGTVYQASGTTVNVKGGTLNGGTATVNGGCFYLTSATLNISGGTLSGGTTTGNGGSIQQAGGTVNISGGTVTGGKSTGSQKQGGNINITSSGTLKMTGGTVSNGTAAGYGGNICVGTGAACTISGGTVSGGKCNSGGNIFVGANATNYGTLTISGGTVSGGTHNSGTTRKGGNLYADGRCTISGGIVTGGNVGNSADTQRGGNIYVNNRAGISKLTVTGGTVTLGTAYYGGNIYVHGGNSSNVFVRGEMTMSAGTVSAGTAAQGGNLYIGGKAAVSGGTVTGGTASVKGGNIQVYGLTDTAPVWGELTLSGGVISTGTANQGGNISIEGKTTITKGVIENGKATGSGACGGNVYVGMIRNSSTKEIITSVEMSGGIIRNGSAVGYYGGNMQCHGDFWMTGGLITGGKAKDGGNVRIFRPGNFVLDGGTVESGIATGSGGNFQVVGHNTSTTATYKMEAYLTVKSGYIYGGQAAKGGNIALGGYGNLTVQGGSITGGKATGNGGSIYAAANNASGGPAYVTVTGGEISGGSADGNGGNLCMADTVMAMELSMTGGTIQNGTAAKGGNLYLVDVAQAVLNGVTVSGEGQSVYVGASDSYAGTPVLKIQGNTNFTGTGTDVYLDNSGAVVPAVVLEGMADPVLLVDLAVKPGVFATGSSTLADRVVCIDQNYRSVYKDDAFSIEADTEPKTVAVWQGNTQIAAYSSFSRAVELIQGGEGYLKLLADVDAAGCTVTDTLWVDLNGYQLEGLTVAGTLYGMDSATNTYSDENTGLLQATLTGNGKIADHCKTSTDRCGAIRRYLAVETGEGYTFHRFYMGITKISLTPNTVGVGYKAVFAGSDTVKAALDQSESFGYKLQIEGNSALTKTVGAENLISLEEINLRVNDFFKAENTAQDNEERANTPVMASVYVKLADGQIIEGSVQSYNYRQMVELADEYYETYSDQQQTALTEMVKTYNTIMTGWFNAHTHHADDTRWQAWTSTNSLPSTGIWYLDTDVTLSATLDIPANQELILCLNGHTVRSSGRTFRPFGTLTICDCCHDEPSDRQGAIISDSTGLAPVFYSYYGSVINLYGGNITATKQVPQAGIGALGNDTNSLATGTGDAVFNMYGGHIYGGNVTGNGGILSAFHGGTINLYGGTISGGIAGGQGGNIYITAGTNDTPLVLNVYDAQVLDGMAQGHGGNIYAAAKTQIHLYKGALVSGGESFSSGGNLYTLGNSGNVLEGATVQNGKATFSGGNILACHELTVKDSVISGGTAGSNGGNFWFDASINAAITGSTVTGGRAVNKGGNLFLLNKGTVNLSHSTLSDGHAGDNGGNLYVFREMEQANTSLVRPAVTLDHTQVTGGSADGLGGGIYVHESDLTLSGNTQITGNTGSNLYLDAGDQVKLQELESTARIGITMSVAGTVTTDTQYAANLISDAGLTVQTADGKLTLAQASTPAVSGYSVGWYRGVITPQEPMPLDGMGNNNGRMDAWAIVTELEAGFTVIADGTGLENAILLVSVDTLFIQKELSDNLAACIADATGIPANRIFFSASHTHCGVDHDATLDQTKHYLEWLYPTMTSYAVQAVADLKPSTLEMASVEVVSSTGQFLSQTRRYVDADGNAYSGVDGDSVSGKEYESVPDRTMQLLRFKRTGGSDVVLTNWQAHPGFMANKNTGNVSAEQWFTFRQSVEEQLPNTVCTFFIGAAGNINSQKTESSFVGADGNTYNAGNMEGFGDALASFVVTALNDESKITALDPGTLKVKNIVFETQDLYKDSMQSFKNIDLDLNVISMGDVAFITAPYEMFHENGDQIKAYAQELGYETCFILTNSGGENKYIASEQAFINDETDGQLTSFEVRTCRFIKGTAELLVQQYQEMLLELTQ